MTRVRLTFAARCRFPDIGTSHGTATATIDDRVYGQGIGWTRVEWPGDRTTWLRAEDIEPVTPDDQQPPGANQCQ
jgi:hypothetical protein